MIYRGFYISFWSGRFHADNGNTRFSSLRDGDIFYMIDEYLN